MNADLRPEDGLPALPPALSDQLLPLLFGDPERRPLGFAELKAHHPEHAAALEAHWQHHLRLEQQAGPWSAADEDVAIPGYRLFSVLGEGGMGTVYRAEQLVPVHRPVALKVIKPGMDSKAVLLRFEHERQALAAMDHDAIAKVFDCGASPRGQPYFAMELVEGLPIHRYCDQKRLSLRDRIELFAQVCQGVQHAHQKGVIHRDLKPGNVLVVDQGGRHAVKIIDFGVARATDRRLAMGSLFTEQGIIVGTPEYMSPEQAAGDARRIDTRTDIYSLGVILYELLVGALPFSGVELHPAGLVETVRRLQEDEPPRPSTRLTTLGREATACAALRRVSVDALRRELAGDLDWVVLKAMAKEPERRYESATAFAEDLQRYLEHEPLRAGPPSGWYQVRKYLRRHRGPLLAAGAVIGALSIGLTFALVQYRKAEDARAHLTSALDEVRAQRTTAQSHLARYELLADMVTLPDLEREVERLWPELPEEAPAMADWLGRARELVTHRARIATALEELKGRTRPLTHAEQEEARQQHPKARELQKQLTRLAQARQELAALRDRKNLSEGDKVRGRFLNTAEIPALEQATEALAAEVEAKLLPRFPSIADQFLHDTLVKLLEALGRLETDALPAIQKRHEWASTVEQRTVRDEQAAWDRAIASIANLSECPLYQGYKLTPQTGLVPLDRNPKSGLWEFWHVRSGKRPERDANGQYVVNDATGIVFALLPGGKFWMGAQATDPNGRNHDATARPAEQSVHEVPLLPFFLAKHEMTQGQWVTWTGRNPSAYQPGEIQAGVTMTLRHPIEKVSWDDCRRVLGQMGLKIPTEAQWEYACRAGTTTVYSTGNDVPSLRGSTNIADEGSKDALEKFMRAQEHPTRLPFDPGFTDGHMVHAPVGSFDQNPWGLFDMHGNLWEWCLEEAIQYPDDPHAWDGFPASDGEITTDGPQTLERVGPRTIRGGSFTLTASEARSATRSGCGPDLRYHDIGVRPSRPVTR